MLCLQTAYLKQNYSIYFFKALFNWNKSDTGKLNKYILDSKLFGVKLVAPHINRSQMDFIIYDDAIMFGLSAISGLGDSVSSVIIEREKNENFKSLADLLSRVQLSTTQVIALIKSGAIPTNDKRKTMMRYIKSLYKPLMFRPAKKLPSYQKLLVDWNINKEDYRIGEKKYDFDKEKMLKDYNKKRQIEFDNKQKLRMQKFFHDHNKYFENEQFWEFEALHIFINNNPFQDAYKLMSKQFEDVKNGDMCTIVGIIANVQKKKDKNKKTFAYANIYSSFGLTEAIIWHSTLKEYEDLIKKGSQIAMYCKKDTEDKVVANKIRPYAEWVNIMKKRKYIA